MSRRYFTPKEGCSYALVVDDENKTAMIQWRQPPGHPEKWDHCGLLTYDAWSGGEVVNKHWQRHKLCSFRKWLRDNKFMELPR